MGTSCRRLRSAKGQTEKSDRPPSRSVLPPEPDIDAKQPAVACGARPVDEFNPNRGRGKGQSHPCRSLKLGPIGACLIRATLFLFQRISHKRLVLMRFLRSLADEKSTGLQDHTTSPSARKAPSSLAPLASTASCPASVTISNRPLCGTGRRGYKVICVSGKSEYFCKRGWTGFC